MTLQIFVQSPEPQVPSQTLTLTPSSTQTLHHLKLSLLPKPLTESFSSSFYFTLNGKPLPDSTLLESPQIAPLSTLVLRYRLSGGGGDGGATGAESRDCYLNMYAERKPDKVDPNEQKLSKWTNCALSNEPLREPCVIDRLGNVFNKEALVEALLGKKLPKEFGYIRGLKDMITVRFSRVPGAAESDENAGGRTLFQCPITGLEINGKYRFLALRNCGHVLSAKALKEVKSSACLVCHEEFQESDKIVINGSEEEVAVLRERMMEEKSKVREKKVKKNGEEGVGLEMSRLSGRKHGIDVKAVEKVASGKLDANGKSANDGVVKESLKRFKAGDMAPANATKEVYASIFTSSKKSNFKETYSCRSLPLGRN
ncbi:replication termination factor 2 [Juglans microcarpa x Juglans regia]|uniref:replication termination factor 2 n=1 Tax=Juglans microcarpa x Juglans regia TaxID=2249226 RepID=UPI001B7E9120|nr:replication termination factor 2 [Juglans microcarpa x Juglans regia]